MFVKRFQCSTAYLFNKSPYLLIRETSDLADVENESGLLLVPVNLKHQSQNKPS